MKKQPRTRMGKSIIMSPEKELDLVSHIRLAEGLWDKKKSELTEEEQSVLEEAHLSCHELVQAYSPLVEKLARERYKGVPEHRASLDDFISEAYIVALQCARTFNPSKSEKPIRFSSYFPRAVVSSLGRMSMYSRTVVSVSASKMTEARKWAHTKFDLENMGVKVSDEEVSEISGVNTTQSEVLAVLGTVNDEDINDVVIADTAKNDIEESEYERNQVVNAINKSCSPYYAIGLLYLMGLKTGNALMTRFLLSVEITPEVGEDYDVRRFLETYPGYLNHPIIRQRMADQLKER